MKKIFLFTALVCVFAAANAQHTTNRFPYESSTLARGDNFNYRYQAVTTVSDTTYGDTVFLSPNAWHTFVSVNDNDTLHGNITLDLETRTVRAIKYTKANCWKLDNLTVLYKGRTRVADTIRFAGAMYYGSTNYIVIPADTTGGAITKFVNFIFDGAKFRKQ
jgi:hypothetical protein